MTRRRRSFEGQQWASHDAWLALAFVFLLLLGRAYVVFLYAALGVLALAALLVTVAAIRRRRRERIGDQQPFWLHEIDR